MTEPELFQLITEIRALLFSVLATDLKTRKLQHFKEIRLLAGKAEKNMK